LHDTIMPKVMQGELFFDTKLSETGFENRNCVDNMNGT